jgi:hypothetical protein
LCVNVEMTDLNCSFDEFLFIAELRPSQEPRLSSFTRTRKSAIMDQLRSKSEKSGAAGELFLADIQNVIHTSTGVQAMLIFNAQHCSWDYSWKSNRWSGPIQDHVVDIIALRSISSQDYAVCCSQESVPFIIISSHKKSANKPVTTAIKGKRARHLTKPRASDDSVGDTTSILHMDTAASSAVPSSGRLSRRKPIPSQYSFQHEEDTDDLDPGGGSSSSGDQQRHRRPFAAGNSGSRKRSHSSSVGEVEYVAEALMSLVRPASYFFDIKKSMAQQQELQQLQLEEEQRQQQLRRNTFQYASDSSASGESGDEQQDADRSSYSRRNAVAIVRPPLAMSSRSYEDLSQDYIILPTR